MEFPRPIRGAPPSSPPRRLDCYPYPVVPLATPSSRSPPRLLYGTSSSRSLPCRPARYVLSALTPRRSMSDAENTSSSDSRDRNGGCAELVMGSSSAVGAPVVARRKWTDEADILLLKEIAARKTHVPVFGRAIATRVPSIKPTQFCRTPLLFANATGYAVARC
jgi:hypothetical protein